MPFPIASSVAGAAAVSLKNRLLAERREFVILTFPLKQGGELVERAKILWPFHESPSVESLRLSIGALRFSGHAALQIVESDAFRICGPIGCPRVHVV